MSAERDQLWADLVQFDTGLADRVWDGDLSDPDAPAWYTHIENLIHRARGPADADELADEPVVIPMMSRAGPAERARTGLPPARPRRTAPRRSPARAAGRIAVLKASAAATTLGMVGVAAATTGLVATVAATVVVPALSADHAPAVSDDVVVTGMEASEPDNGRGDGDGDGAGRAPCPPTDDPCARLGAPVAVVSGDVPAGPHVPVGAATPAPGAGEAEADSAAAVEAPAEPAPSGTPDAATATTEPVRPDPGHVVGRAPGDRSPPVLPSPLEAGAGATDGAVAPSQAASPGPPVTRPPPPRGPAAGAAAARR